MNELEWVSLCIEMIRAMHVMWRLVSWSIDYEQDTHTTGQLSRRCYRYLMVSEETCHN